MDQRIVVDVDLLERVFAILVGHLREVEGGEVYLDHDYFWSVPPDLVAGVNQAPTDFTVGQVSECLDWLSALAKSPDDALKFHLVWLAEVLRAVGQTGEVGTA